MLCLYCTQHVAGVHDRHDGVVSVVRPGHPVAGGRLNRFDTPQDGSSSAAPPTITGTMEQRVTGSCIHLLIGCCVFFATPRNLLTNIPKPVLMGLFLYLGTSALPGNEMWERIKGLFQDNTVTTKERWSGVSNKVVNGFTVLQCACLGAMFWVKSSPIGVLFPIIIALLAPLRFALEKFNIISKEDMDVLDFEG